MIPTRIFGIETEYGITAACTAPGAHLGQRPDSMEAEEAAHLLFEPVVRAGRSTSTFLPNGARLYLDVGAHPEYATAECDNIEDLIANDRAGELLYGQLLTQANAALERAGRPLELHLFKANSDSHGNSYGCHENYLVRRRRDFQEMAQQLVAFFISRQVVTGAGTLQKHGDGRVRFAFAQRAQYMWDALSSATTQSRPIINTRDEPHADSEHYRRLHVISGDSSVSEASTGLKIAITDLLLGCLERGMRIDDLVLSDPMRAIRETSADMTGTTQCDLASGRRMSAAAMQREYHRRVIDFLDKHGDLDELDQGRRYYLGLWERALDAIEGGDYSAVDTELDWAIKLRLFERYRDRHSLGWEDVRLARLDLAYHDITPGKGLAEGLRARGLMKRLVSLESADQATRIAPATTRASLRGRVIAAAKAKRLDLNVDWVHMKLPESHLPAIALQDPFAVSDARVDALLAEIG